jgi:catechol 2,3-dioxygenase-like lactoylglutathione lyase family enzyme
MRISVASLIVNDPLEAHRVYTEVLGFTSRVFVPESRLAIVASPEEPGGTGLLLEPNDHPVGKTFPQAICEQGLPAIVLGTDDIQREHDRLAKLGVSFTQAPTRTDWGVQAGPGGAS